MECGFQRLKKGIKLIFIFLFTYSNKVVTLEAMIMQNQGSTCN